MTQDTPETFGDAVTLTRHDKIAIVTLDRDDGLNALSIRRTG